MSNCQNVLYIQITVHINQQKQGPPFCDLANKILTFQFTGLIEFCDHANKILTFQFTGLIEFCDHANKILTFQFTGLIDFCDHAANLGIVVVVAALSGDFERKVNNGQSAK